MKEEIVFLYGYTRWASQRMWQAIAHLNEEQWLRPQAYSVGSVHDQVVHMMYAPARWLHFIKGTGEKPILEPKQFPRWQDAENRWHTLWNGYFADVAGFQESDLQRVVPWGPSSRGFQGNTPCWQILIHLATHTMDHRSQIFMTMNTQFGIPTPEQDVFFYFTELGEAARLKQG